MISVNGTILRGYDITIDASTNDVRVRATGANSHNIRWNCTVRIHAATT